VRLVDTAVEQLAAAAVARKRALVSRQGAEALADRGRGWMICHTGQSVGSGAAVGEIVVAVEIERIVAAAVAGRRAVVEIEALVGETVAGVPVVVSEADHTENSGKGMGIAQSAASLSEAELVAAAGRGCSVVAWAAVELCRTDLVAGFAAVEQTAAEEKAVQVECRMD
jgi:hypothetical protein